MSGDVNAILRVHLAANAGIIAKVGARIYCPRLPEKAILPAIGFFVRGGFSTPYIPQIVEPSFQFDCWADDPIEARSVYTAVYDCLQGVQDASVTIGATTYRILSAVEEAQGQDIQGVEEPGYHRVLTFFRVMIEI